MPFLPDSRPRHVERGAYRLAAVVLIVSAVAAQVHAAEPSLTLGDAQRRAVERSLQVVAHDAAIDASRNMAVAAGQLPDPMLRAGIDNLPITGPDRFSL